MVSAKPASIEIVAELGSVHDGSFGNAIKLVECAAAAGATTAKFQLHIPEAETLRDAPNPKYFTSENRFDYFTRTSFTDSQWSELRERCHALGLKFGCSVFSEEAVEKVVEYGVDIVKVPSGEVTNHPMLYLLRDSGKAIHMSSGMSNWKEIESAVEILNSAVNQLTVLQCTSLYPTLPRFVGLNIIHELKARINDEKVSIGFSDHSQNIHMPIAAVALGATVVEKHLTFSRKMYGSDAFNALEPDEFFSMSSSINSVYEAIRNPVDKDDLRFLEESRNIFQKSVFYARNLRSGEVLTLKGVKFLKPGTGVQPNQWSRLEGRILKRDVVEGDKLSEEDLC